METIFPLDVWTTVSGYLFETMYLEKKVFPKHKYLIETFKGNIDYIHNKRLLDKQMPKYVGKNM